MSLAPREQGKLAAIENALRAKDPRLEAMFRAWDKRDPGDGPQLRRMSLSPCAARRGRGAAIIVLATIVVLLTTCAVAIALLA